MSHDAEKLSLWCNDTKSGPKNTYMDDVAPYKYVVGPISTRNPKKSDFWTLVAALFPFDLREVDADRPHAHKVPVAALFLAIALELQRETPVHNETPATGQMLDEHTTDWAKYEVSQR